MTIKLLITAGVRSIVLGTALYGGHAMASMQWMPANITVGTFASMVAEGELFAYRQDIVSQQLLAVTDGLDKRVKMSDERSFSQWLQNDAAAADQSLQAFAPLDNKPEREPLDYALERLWELESYDAATRSHYDVKAEEKPAAESVDAAEHVAVDADEDILVSTGETQYVQTVVANLENEYSAADMTHSFALLHEELRAFESFYHADGSVVEHVGETPNAFEHHAYSLGDIIATDENEKVLAVIAELESGADNWQFAGDALAVVEPVVVEQEATLLTTAELEQEYIEFDLQANVVAVAPIRTAATAAVAPVVMAADAAQQEVVMAAVIHKPLDKFFVGVLLLSLISIGLRFFYDTFFAARQGRDR